MRTTPLLNLAWHDIDAPKIPKHIGRKPWELTYPRTNNWKSAKQKVLLVIDHVPTPNLQTRKLASSQERVLLENVIRRAFTVARSWAKEDGSKRPKMKDYAWCIVSWANFKTYDLQDRQPANEYLIERMRSIIADLQPTKIHYLGEEPAWHMHRIGVERRAWVLKQITEQHHYTASSNLSITQPLWIYKSEGRRSIDGYSYDMSPDDANLLGHISENLARMILGYYPYSLAHLKPKYTIVDTMGAWKALLSKLWKAHRFSLDLETNNLSVYENGIVTAQFAFDSKLCYIVPLKCIGSPWTSGELREILSDMRSLFGREIDQTDWKAPYIIGQNLAFDFRVLCVELGLHTIDVSHMGYHGFFLRFGREPFQIEGPYGQHHRSGRRQQCEAQNMGVGCYLVAVRK